jgi:hypothetical protein
MTKASNVENANNLTSKEVTVSSKGPSAVMIGGTAFNVKRLVTVPTLQQETGETVAIEFLSPIETKPNNETINGVVVEKFINVARVRELSSGQEFAYVLNAITEGNIREAYPHEGYVGKCFAIKKLGVVAGKRYKDVQVVEIDPVG